jgi:shikimate dehydrogenase
MSSIASSYRASSLKQAKHRVVLLLGTGISKSISPLIHNKAYHELGLDLEYKLCDIPEDLLDRKLDELLKDEKVIGFNVTIPFKEKIIKRLSEIESVAKQIRAVNLVTISTDRRKMTGYNTDVDGIVASLSKLGLIGRDNQYAVILGSGGAARACVYALLSNGFESVDIMNRSIERAEKVVRDFLSDSPEKKIRSFVLTSHQLENSLLNADLLVNTIPLTAELPFEVSFASARKGLKYLDLNYRKGAPILQMAKKEGVACIDGSLMLVEQAARSFEILTGISAPRKTMMLATKRAE